ncbi:GmrSD restriction endonuclease domain-containing protein [Ornithinimicrobium sp. W1665]|uniref:GmrSD restriction endonuclease domain-containing protein n=1 Tax=Ornithinimicrobium sp. W1665 TaxID=3416666 RepID=UPI003CE6B8A9
MGFLTPMYELGEYLTWTRSGGIQLPDFQRGYKWEDERIRQLLITVLRGHPMGAVMLLKTGNTQVRFKPRAIEGVELLPGHEALFLLLDGQQRLTSLTQALSGTGHVDTKDSRGKLLERRYLVHMETALSGSDRVDEAVISVPADGVIRTNFGKDVVLDLSDEHKQREQGYFPLHLLYGDYMSWILELEDRALGKRFHEDFIKPAATYDIPAIVLDERTEKAAVATVFEKVNIGGLPLNVFELLTAMFAGDPEHFARTGEDFRLNDDWREIQQSWAAQQVLTAVENTDFLQAVTMLTTRKRHLADTSDRPPAISAKREDVLKLTLNDYLEWREPLREAFVWAATFLADRHIFTKRDVPYAKQLVPLAAIKVVLGKDADLLGVSERLARWYWCGVLGELYGSAIESRFARDIEMVPPWATDAQQPLPRTVADANFTESRLHSLRTRNAAAYKGIAALILGGGARDWMEDKALDKVQYMDLAVDIHHVFPQKWCADHAIDDERRESIVNKTTISARTNRTIGGAAPSEYLRSIESRAQVDATRLDQLLSTHLIDASHLRSDDFDEYFVARRERLCLLVETAIGKSVQRDVDEGHAEEDSAHFDEAQLAEDLIEEEAS